MIKEWGKRHDILKPFCAEKVCKNQQKKKRLKLFPVISLNSNDSLIWIYTFYHAAGDDSPSQKKSPPSSHPDCIKQPHSMVPHD